MAEEVLNIYPNPWDFFNGNPQLISNDGINKIEYDNLMEIAMGAPLGGPCSWINQTGEKQILEKWCGGPALWNTTGTKVAIPGWTRKFLRGTVQQIMVLDIEKRELIRYKKIFNVLDLRTFDGNEICGYDSPMYRKKIVRFDLLAEKVTERKKIKTGANNTYSK